MNWGKDSHLFLQISKKKKTAPFAAEWVREKCLMLHVLDIFGWNVFFSKFSWVTISDNARLDLFWFGPDPARGPKGADQKW